MLRFDSYPDKSTWLPVIALAFLLARLALHAQSPPLVIAWQAPDCSSAGNPTWCQNFIKYELPSLSGIGITMTWSAVDNCTALGGPCLSDSSCSGATCYNWAAVDNSLDAYINYTGIAGWNWKTGCAGGKPCKIVIIVKPEVDSGNVNTATPQYVFSAAYASGLPGSPGAQDVVVCSGFQGAGGTVELYPLHNWQSNDFAIWHAGNCSVLSGNDIKCSGSIPDFSGFPVVYEQPIMTAYQTLLTNLAGHYSPSGIGKGPEVSPYLAYVRAGMASGGENNPQCEVYGTISSSDWGNPLTVPAGYVVQPSIGNSGKFIYVADSAGSTGSAAPFWCQNGGCYTSSDGTISRWHNVGSRTVGMTATPIWPGPKGQFPPGNQPQEYSDNGYLASWSAPSANGYVATMMQFLAGVGATFPWDVSSHFGPDSSSGVPPDAYAYADAEALLAAQSGIGFGMQSLNIGDPISSPLGVYPTSRQDWVANFQKYPNAPVHHLQLNDPGTTYFWPGYYINNITVTSGEATITCEPNSVNVLYDCSPFSGQEIFISGNSNILLNGTWMVNCTGAMGACLMNQLQFSTAASFMSTPTGYGGIVWSPNYWPITMPFALQRGATSLELWECDLDYAFGQVTTQPVPNETSGSGCPEWGLIGPDTNYENAISNTLLGQPAITSFHSDNFSNSWQF